jgi:hypothetical protein
MSVKSIACVSALVSLLSLAASDPKASAGESATLSFSGYVAPACMVTNLDSNAVLPPGVDPANYVLLRCNTGEPDRVVEGGSRSSLQVKDNGELVTIVP